MLIDEVNQEFLIDKLFERWAAERLAIDLYDLAIGCARRDGTDDAVVERLGTFQAEEKAHGDLIEALLRRFGRDVRTEGAPSVDIVLEEMGGLIDVCRRRDASLRICLQALLAAELIDNAGWDLLEDLCDEAGIDQDVVREMRAAKRQEAEHLHYVRTRLAMTEREELIRRPL